MSSLSSLYLKKETLETLVATLNKKGEKGVEITISTNDDSNEYGNNISAYVSQSKEQREAKAKKYFVGNGKVFWTDGSVVLGKKKEVVDATIEPQSPESLLEEDDDLPF